MPKIINLFTRLAEAKLKGERILFGIDNDGVMLPIGCPTIDPFARAVAQAQMARGEAVIITGRDGHSFMHFANADKSQPPLAPAFISANHGAEFIVIDAEGNATSSLLVEGLTDEHEKVILANISACKTLVAKLNAQMGFPEEHSIIVEGKTTFDNRCHLGYTIQVRPAMDWICQLIKEFRTLEAAQTFIQNLHAKAGLSNHYVDKSLEELKAHAPSIAASITNHLEKTHFHPLVKTQATAIPCSTTGEPLFKLDIIECDTGVQLAGSINKGEFLIMLLTQPRFGHIDNPFYNPAHPTHVIYTGDDFFIGDERHHAGTDSYARTAGLELAGKGAIASYTTIQVARAGKPAYSGEPDVVYLAGDLPMECSTFADDSQAAINRRGPAEHGRFKLALEEVLCAPEAFLAIKDNPAELAGFFAKYQLTGPRYTPAPAAATAAASGSGLFASGASAAGSGSAVPLTEAKIGGTPPPAQKAMR